jgi:hypothetical protein
VARIDVQGFQGEVPALEPRVLPERFAQVARNCDFSRGSLRPIDGMRRVGAAAKAGTIRSLFRWAAQAGQDAEGEIAQVSDTTPVQVTSATPHGLATGQRVFLAGTGLALDDAYYSVTVTGADTFTLDDTAAAGTAASGTWTKENGYWFHWSAPVDVVRSPTAGNADERVYYTGDGRPKMTYSPIAVQGATREYPLASYDLGVPAPGDSPTVNIVETALTITGITNAKPVVVTVADHGLATGSRVAVAGVTGMSEVNGATYTITVLDSDTFELDGTDGRAWGAYGGAGTATVVGATDPTLLTSRRYVYTYVSALGEEGPPSDDSRLIEVAPGQSVELSALATGPTDGSYNIDRKRIYRAVSSAIGTQYQFVAELAIATQTYNDTIADADLGAVLPSWDPAFPGSEWSPPPQALAGLTLLGNGVLAGYVGNEVRLTPPYQPHAWPVAYRHVTPYPVVAIGALGRSVVAVDHVDAYLITGATPEAMDMTPLRIEQPCVSARGLVSLGNGGVAYPGPDGLVLITESGADIVTAGYLTREDWQALRPESIHAYLLDGQYVAFYDDGTTQAGFIFDPAAEGGRGLVRIDTYATAGYRDALSDALYLVVGNRFERWDAAALARLRLRWRSRPFELRGACLSCAQVWAEGYADLVLRVYVDGVLLRERTVTSRRPFRLPPREGDDWTFEVEGTETVHRVSLASTMRELP